MLIFRVDNWPRPMRENDSRSSINCPIRLAAAAIVFTYFPALLIEPFARVRVEQGRKAGDMTQRRPQIVRDRVAERLELLVHGIELRGPLPHALLERLVRRQQRLVARVNLRQHVVERVDQDGDLFRVAFQLGARRVVPSTGHAPRNLRQIGEWTRRSRAARTTTSARPARAMRSGPWR